MVLYDLTDGTLRAVAKSSFAAEGIWERRDLQRALREDIGLLGDDLLVVAEEFGEFEGGHRRIDLLCVDPTGQMVVVELKRTSDGGHSELQALRYAAMVSTMTFDDLERAYRRHLEATTGIDPDEARPRLEDWLDDGAETVIGRAVRIVLVSAGFDKEITTAVLWLNDVYGLDIRCVRLTPYRVEGRLLLDVQQVVPLPEAEELMVRLRRRENAVKAAASSGKDLTRFVIITPDGTTDALPKRQAIRALVVGLHAAGVPATSIEQRLPNAKFFSVDGDLDDQDLVDAFVARYPGAKRNLERWFLDTPLHEAGQTWVLSKMWGLSTERILHSLIELAPDGAFAVEPIAR